MLRSRALGAIHSRTFKPTLLIPNQKGRPVDVQRFRPTDRQSEVARQSEIELDEPVSGNELDARIFVDEVQNDDEHVIADSREVPMTFSLFGSQADAGIE